MKNKLALKKMRLGTHELIACTSLWLLLVSLPIPAVAETVYATPYTFTTLPQNTDPANAPGTNAELRLCHARGLAADAGGDLYVANTRDHTICRFSSPGNLTILAGRAGDAGSADGTGNNARFYYPASVAVDGAGNIYVADSHNNTIRRVTSAGAVTTVAGEAGQFGSADGMGSEARFNYPNGVAVDKSGNVYVADLYNFTIRKITPNGHVTTLAGKAGSMGSADGKGNAARFNSPVSVAVDSEDNVYVADMNNNAIRKVTPTGVVATLAGRLTFEGGSTDGVGSGARFYHPYGLVVDSVNNVYVADSVNHTIRRVTPTGAVTTLAGQAGQIGSADGTGSAAHFCHPHSLALDRAGNVYVGDSGNAAIRKGSAAAPALLSLKASLSSTTR